MNSAPKLFSRFVLFFCISVNLIINFNNCYGQTGVLDTSFNAVGLDTLPGNSMCFSISSVVVQADGKILSGGNGRIGTRAFGSVLRYNSNGSIDTTFANKGIDTISQMAIVSMVLQSDGKILTAGFQFFHNRQLFAMARIKRNGGLDSTFGINGINRIYSDYGNGATGIALTKNNKIIVCGSFTDSALVNYFTVYKFNANGKLDTTFGDKKGLTHTYIYGDATPFALIIDKQGKIVLGGYSSDGTNSYFTLVRYDSLGHLDTTFGFIGRITQSVCGKTPAYEYIHALTLQQDGKIIAVGESGHYIDTVFVEFMVTCRYNADGSLDPTFGQNGVDTLLFYNKSAFGTSLVLQKDCKILVAGYCVGAANKQTRFALARYNTNGTLDSIFGDKGLDTVAFCSSCFCRAFSMALQPDNKIIIAGDEAVTSLKSHFAMARYLPGIVLNTLDFTHNKNEIKVFPNPVSSTLTVSYTLKNNEIISMFLYDIQARIVKTFTENECTSSGYHNKTIELKNLSAGIYILSINNGSGSINVKIVKE